ncbi:MULTISPECIES: hypothetical protein [unclassified Campylobacter]|uniref:hypothetical protein n=1 Tax=unclassified Campylobacter TaxID=2593542 RepID=UPI003D33A29B
MSLALQKFKDRFNELDTLYMQSEIFQQSKESFEAGLERFMFSEQEKAMAYADFMSKAFSAILTTATEATLRLGLSYEQEITENAKREPEISALNEQVLKLRIDQELGLASKALTLAQNSNENLRKLELEATIRLKEQQLLGTYISNVAENEKRKVLIKTANDNAIIKRGEHLNNYLKVLSDDKDFNIRNENLHTLVKDNVLSIGTNPLKEESIAITKPDLMPIDLSSATNADKLTTAPIVRIISSNEPKQNELTHFYCLIAGADQKTIKFTWTIEGDSYTAQKVMHKFSTKGKQEIVCEININGEIYTQKESINVK